MKILIISMICGSVSCNPLNMIFYKLSPFSPQLPRPISLPNVISLFPFSFLSFLSQSPNLVTTYHRAILSLLLSFFKLKSTIRPPKSAQPWSSRGRRRHLDVVGSQWMGRVHRQWRSAVRWLRWAGAQQWFMVVGYRVSGNGGSVVSRGLCGAFEGTTSAPWWWLMSGGMIVVGQSNFSSLLFIYFVLVGSPTDSWELWFLDCIFFLLDFWFGD